MYGTYADQDLDVDPCLVSRLWPYRIHGELGRDHRDEGAL